MGHMTNPRRVGLHYMQLQHQASWANFSSAGAGYAETHTGTGHARLTVSLALALAKGGFVGAIRHMEIFRNFTAADLNRVFWKRGDEVFK